MRKQLAAPEEICLFIRLSLIRHSKKKGAFTYAKYYLINVSSAKPATKIITCEYSCLSSLLAPRSSLLAPRSSLLDPRSSLLGKSLGTSLAARSEERGGTVLSTGYQDQRGNLNSAFFLLNLRGE